MNKLAVAIFTPFFSAGDELESGIGVHYRDLAIGLKQSGEDVVVFHFPYDTTESKSWDFEGIKVHSVGIKTPAITKIRGIGSLCNLVKFFDFFEAFQLFAKSRTIFSKYHNSKSFNIIEASSNRGVAFGVSTLRRRPPIFTRVSTTMKQIFESENQKPDLNFRFAAKFEEKQILRSDHIVTHTQNHANEVSGILNLNPTLFKLIPHGISSNQRTELKERNMHHSSMVRILFVGRLEHRKGFDVFVRAIPTILESFPDIHIDICGTGEMLEKAKADLFASHSSKIDFHGYQTREALDLFYSNCDIFVGPSRYESFGIVYLEAMKFSKPVIACNSGGTPEVVLDGITGILVEPGNVDFLAKAVLKLANDQVLRKKMGKEGRIRLEKFFSMKTLIETTKSCYLANLTRTI